MSQSDNKEGIPISDVSLPDDLSDMTLTHSDDGKITLYTCNTGQGGSSPSFLTYIQYVSDEDTIIDYLYPNTASHYVCATDITREGKRICEGSFSTLIGQITLSSSEAAYLIKSFNRISGTEGEQDVCVVQFNDGRLVKLPFVLKDGETVFSESCLYHISDWNSITEGLGTDWIINYDRASNTLYVPEKGSLVMNDRYDMYRFINGKMRYVESGAGYWLHPSLHDFKSLVAIYQNGKNLFRVDLVGDPDHYRLAIWSESKDMSTEPELIIFGSKRDNAIVFKDGEYTYILSLPPSDQNNDFVKNYKKIQGYSN